MREINVFYFYLFYCHLFIREHVAGVAGSEGKPRYLSFQLILVDLIMFPVQKGYIVVGRTWETSKARNPGGLLIRFKSYLNWLLLIWRIWGLCYNFHSVTFLILCIPQCTQNGVYIVLGKIVFYVYLGLPTFIN